MEKKLFDLSISFLNKKIRISNSSHALDFLKILYFHVIVNVVIRRGS